MIPVIEFKGLCKSFHGLQANIGIDLKVGKGTIHAIIGENGAGKSTAMKILYGTCQPDQGEIFINGKLWGGKGRPWSSPAEAIHAGIGMVHQHFMLAGPLSALDNTLLGSESSLDRWKALPSFLRPIDRKEAQGRLEQLASQFGMKVDWTAKVETLSVGIQQRIEILKLLYRNAEVLILDEPTAVLTPQEVNDLFLNLRRLSAQGKTILIITHKLKEVMKIADRVTVFRAGRVVGERNIQETNTEDLAALMVGRKMNLRVDVKSVLSLKAPALEMRELSLEADLDAHTTKKLSDLTFTVQGGEIVGIAGVEGNGQAELLQMILHPRDHASKMKGSLQILGKDVRHLNANQVRALGVGVIPDDRLRDALLLDRSVSENFLLGLHRTASFNRNGLISKTELEKATQEALEEYDIRPRSIQARSGGLSGGNQQKLVIAREFKTAPKFLIAAQPTRGVDIGAIDFIHNRIVKARDAGSGVLLISSELDEILTLSDRILVMYEGKIVAEFNRGEVTEKDLGLRMGGVYGVPEKDFGPKS